MNGTSKKKEAAGLRCDLALVMPVYNEEECIADVVRSWRQMLAGLGARFLMIVLNDGSKDRTAEVLEPFSGDESIRVINKPNSGHGPTILEGYRLAVDRARWVFQCDSDNEMAPDGFPALWQARRDYDALFGYRAGRRQGFGRKVISMGSRATVRLLSKRGVEDVNTPYRLIRSDLLREIIAQIPRDTFAPNVIISGAIARAGLRVLNVPVPHQSRKTGTVSIMKWKLWKAAFRSFWQTLRCRPVVTVPPEGPRSPED
jgi:glycosyltransferase involved in cell wall biosynthesis